MADIGQNENDIGSNEMIIGQNKDDIESNSMNV